MDLHVRLLLPGLGLLLVGGSLAARRAARQFASSPPPALLEQAAALTRLRFPSVGDMCLIAERTSAWGRDGTRLSLWHIECDAADGRYLGSVDLNADTGDLREMHCGELHDMDDTNRRPFGPKDAVPAAWGWLRATGMAAHGDRWRLGGACWHSPGLCSVAWTAPGWWARITMRDKTGDLVAASCRPVGTPVRSAQRGREVLP